MTPRVISVEHLTKKYDLGVIGTGTLSRDFERWWARVRKQPDPYTIIGREDRFKKLGESILALDDISFSVNQGETLGIIGKNGAGKSTLLKILSRVTAPTSGVVKVKGRIGSLLEVGTGFHPELTGRENVFLNGAILGMKKAEVARKFDEIVDFSGVEKFIDTPVKRYSSGMYVRLAFAVAAHLDPEILIVDEVLAVGDAEFQKKCLGKMGDVASEGRTVLFVSHNMASISQLCNQAIILEHGKLSKIGGVDECIADYISEHTHSRRKITEGITLLSSKLEIHEILINNDNSSIMTLAENQQDLNVVIRGKVNERIRIEMEVRFYDYLSKPLGVYCPGHVTDTAEWYEPNEFTISRLIKLPKITRGEYFLTINLTDPSRTYWMQAPLSIHMIAEGSRLLKGATFDYSKGNGWIILP